MTFAEPVSPEATAERHQTSVNRYFTSESQAWKEIYEKQTAYSVIHQERRVWALDRIDGLDLPSGTRVLEVGCGAGLTSVALAQRRLSVSAIDSVAEMVRLTGDLARERAVDDRIDVAVADAQELPFEDETFTVVVALGVLAWIHEPDRALAEMTRLVRPGGSLVTNVDNILRSHFLLDPRLNPAARPLKRALREGLQRLHVVRTPAAPSWHLRSNRSFDASLTRLGLQKVVGVNHGFGPFTFMGRPVFSDADGVRLHHLLQAAADDRFPLLERFGAQYFVHARKPNGAEPGLLPETPVE